MSASVLPDTVRRRAGGSRRGRLARYAAWQLADFTTQRGLPSVLISSFFLILAYVSTGRLVAYPEGAPVAGLALDGLAGALTFFAPTAVLLAVNGVVSDDRKYHFYRFLFAKPISVSRYYAQALLVSGVGFLLVCALFLGGYAVVIYPVFPPGALVYLGLYFVAFGGLGFLLSSITKHDWLVLSFLWGLALLLRLVVDTSRSWWGRALDVLLPPVDRLSEIGAPLVRGVAVPSDMILRVAAYGVVCIAIGLIVIRQRPLAS